MSIEFHPPDKLKLTNDEQKLFDQIDFEMSHSELGGRFHDVLKKSCEAAKPLTLMLLKRNAVPRIRKDYFTDAAYNIGSKSSRMQVFESNGTAGEDIFEHGHFLAILRYWILGPNLPPEVIRGFCDILNNDIGTSGMELKRRHKYVRDQTRLQNLQKCHAEEFYKLALEVGLDESTSRGIRDASKGVR